MFRRRELLWEKGGGGGRLPDEYQEVTYIESSGAQYINAEFSSPGKDGTISVECDFEFTADTSNRMELVSVYGTSGRQYIYAGCQSGKFYIVSSNTVVTNSVQCSQNIRYKTVTFFEQRNQTFSVNGEIVANSTYSLIGELLLDVWLFAQHDIGDNKPYRFATAKLYSIKVNKNGELIRDFVPCYRKADGEVGLYDLVDLRFFENLGTGSFSKGADV